MFDYAILGIIGPISNTSRHHQLSRFLNNPGLHTMIVMGTQILEHQKKHLYRFPAIWRYVLRLTITGTNP